MRSLHAAIGLFTVFKVPSFDIDRTTARRALRALPWVGLLLGFVAGAFGQVVGGSLLGAALALGLGKSHIFFRIVLPQAWRHALPGLGNQWLVLLKDTALVSLIGVNEMMRQAQMASASTYEPFTWYAAAALIYLAISLVSEFGLKQAANYTRRYGG